MRGPVTVALACLALAGCAGAEPEDIRWGTEGSIHAARIVQVSPDDRVYTFSRIGAQPAQTRERQGPEGTYQAVRDLAGEIFDDPPEGSEMACSDYGSDFIERSVGNTVLERVASQCPSEGISAAMEALDALVAGQFEGAPE